MVPEVAQHLHGINIYLIGMMGSGKTTIGQHLAQRFDYRFFDTDLLIERVRGLTISEIFEQEGEASFREWETRILAELSPYTRSVIATGGGIVLKRENWSYLQQGFVIWLDVPVAELVQRLQADTSRPLLQETNLAEKLSHILEQRQAFYQEADLRVELVESLPPDVIADWIIELMPTALKETRVDHS